MINISNQTFIKQLSDIINHAHKVFILFVVVWALLITAGLLTCGSGFAHADQSLPPAEKLSNNASSLNGSTILETQCSLCHSTDKAKRVKMTPDQWEKTVNRMIEKGAKLSEEEKTVLLDYLSKTYGEGS